MADFSAEKQAAYAFQQAFMRGSHIDSSAYSSLLNPDKPANELKTD